MCFFLLFWYLVNVRDFMSDVELCFLWLVFKHFFVLVITSNPNEVIDNVTDVEAAEITTKASTENTVFFLMTIRRRFSTFFPET